MAKWNSMGDSFLATASSSFAFLCGRSVPDADHAVSVHTLSHSQPLHLLKAAQRMLHERSRGMHARGRISSCCTTYNKSNLRSMYTHIECMSAVSPCSGGVSPVRAVSAIYASPTITVCFSLTESLTLFLAFSLSLSLLSHWLDEPSSLTLGTSRTPDTCTC